MKKISKLLLISIIILIWLLPEIANVHAQNLSLGLHQRQEKIEEKVDYEYIVVYRVWEQLYREIEFSYIYVDEWCTRIRGFESWEKMMEWLNSSGYHSFPPDKQKKVRLTEDELIAIYDLTRAIPVTLKLVLEERVEPKRIEIQEEKWTDYEWIEDKQE